MPKRSPTARALLAAAVKRERKRKGWTQLRASQEIGIHLRHVQFIEAGHVNVTVDTVDMIAKAFGVAVSDLFAHDR